MSKQRLSKNFTQNELRCEDNCEEAKYPKMSIVILLELIREHFGNKYNARCIVEPTDGCRCFDQNEKTQKKWYPINNNGKEYVPGSSKSRHMDLEAADFKVFVQIGYKKQVSSQEVHDYLDSIFPYSMGFGIYHNRNHADCRVKKARWDSR